jgi:hypothetical protein
VVVARVKLEVERDRQRFDEESKVPSATSVRGLQLLVYEALSYYSVTSSASTRRARSLKLLVYEALSY